MEENKKKLYTWEGLNWDINQDINGNLYAVALCPKQKCNCRLENEENPFSSSEHTYYCVICDFKITLNKSIEEKGNNLVMIIESFSFKDAEIINIDGELIRIKREGKEDDDYWVDVKLSKSKKGEVQLMVLAGSKKNKDKTQLFLDPRKERLAFDQNNDHPSKVFAKVVGTFKNSKSEIHSEN